jgi:hypothetical protein
MNAAMQIVPWYELCLPSRDNQLKHPVRSDPWVSAQLARGDERVKVLHSKITFIVLQVLDLLTTLAAFHIGAYEVNPLVASLAMLFGPVGGLVCSKVIASLIVIRVRRLVWVANVFYGGVICWNVIVVVALLVRRH